MAELVDAMNYVTEHVLDIEDRRAQMKNLINLFDTSKPVLLRYQFGSKYFGVKSATVKGYIRELSPYEYICISKEPNSSKLFSKPFIGDGDAYLIKKICAMDETGFLYENSVKVASNYVADNVDSKLADNKKPLTPADELLLAQRRINPSTIKPFDEYMDELFMMSFGFCPLRDDKKKVRKIGEFIDLLNA